MFWINYSTSLLFLKGKFSKKPSVFITASHHHAGLKRDAASIWMEDITQSSFKICLRELQNYAGSHEDIYVVSAVIFVGRMFSLSPHNLTLPLPFGNPLPFMLDHTLKEVQDPFLCIDLYLLFVYFSLYFRTGWRLCLFTSLSSQSTIQFILQTLSILRLITITPSAR